MPSKDSGQLVQISRLAQGLAFRSHMSGNSQNIRFSRRRRAALASFTRIWKAGFRPCRRKAEVRDALEKAFDYRGDLTITLKSRQKIEGYVFDRRIKGPSLAECFVRVMPKDTGEKLSIAVQRRGRARLHRTRHCRRKKLRHLGKEVQRKESRRRKEHRPGRRIARLAARRPGFS